MKPARFDYAAPGGLREALMLLERERDATVLAGGQSLVPMLNLRLARPRLVLDINRLAELDGVSVNGGSVTVGALTRLRVIERSDLVRRACPLLADAAALIATPAVRTRGTIGGSVAHADPRAELPAALLALGAVFRCADAAGERSIPAQEFFLGPMMTALRPGELLYSVDVPALPEGARTCFVERRVTHAAFAQAGVAVVLAPGVHPAIGVLGAGPVALRASSAERAWLDGADSLEVAELVGGLTSDKHRAALLCALTLDALEAQSGDRRG